MITMSTTGLRPLHGRVNARKLRRQKAAEAWHNRARKSRQVKLWSGWAGRPHKPTAGGRVDPWKRSKPSPHRRRRMRAVDGETNKTVWCYADEVKRVAEQMVAWEDHREKRRRK